MPRTKEEDARLEQLSNELADINTRREEILQEMRELHDKNDPLRCILEDLKREQEEKKQNARSAETIEG